MVLKGIDNSSSSIEITAIVIRAIGPKINPKMICAEIDNANSCPNPIMEVFALPMVSFFI